MGVVNVTPDSFSDGGAFASPEAAIAHGMQLVDAGADIVDVGGESTRPRADSVDEAEERRRIMPVIAALVAEGAVVSVDTSKPGVAAAAVGAGAEIINDVRGLREPGMAEVCVESAAGVVIMHMQGTPRTMQDEPRYDDVVDDVHNELMMAASGATERGVDADRICLDPGIGFGKTSEHNLALLGNLEGLTQSRYPILVGPSRKRFLGDILERTGRPAAPQERDVATTAAVATSIGAGAFCVRVHDVALALDAACTADAIVRASRKG
jgi:dihydropteroate synthase